MHADHSPQRRSRAGGAVTLLSLALVAALVMTGPRVFGELDIFDEGFIATGAMLVRQGALPERDFFSIYGPAQYMLNALLFELFGENVTVTRCAHAFLLACIGAGIAATAWRLSGRRAAMVAAPVLGYALFAGSNAPNSGYPSVAATLLMLPSAALLAAGSLERRAGKLIFASVLIGIAGAFRWDYAIYGLFALGATVITLAWLRKLPLRVGLVMLCATVLPGLAIASLATAALAFSGDASRWFAEVPLFYWHGYSAWRNDELLAPTIAALTASLKAGDAWSSSRALTKLAFAGLPVLLCCAALALFARQARAAMRSGTNAEIKAMDVHALAMALMALVLFNQMRVRPGYTQGFSSFVIALPLLAYIGARLDAHRSAVDRTVRFVGTGVIAGVLLLAAYAWQGDWRLMLAARNTGHELPRATQVLLRTPSAERNWNDYVSLIHDVQARTSPGERILSGAADMSRLHINDAMLYFLANRPAATRWVEMEPGQTNSEAGQRGLIESLERHQVRVVVLVDRLSNEPNGTSRSNGVHMFDAFMKSHYQQAARHGKHTLWIRREQRP